MVFLSSRISPFTSTVIFFDRSPSATAVVTSAMLRTWPVRFSAIRLTLSVRSFQVPPTPSTRAWPPSLPSVPTSRATRVTSDAKELSWSTIVLMVFLSSRISPFTSTVIFFDRSPDATAVVTSAMLRTWPVRLVAMALTLSVRSFQVPATPFTRAWPPSLPSVPTSRATRVTSEAKEASWSTMVLTILPMRRNSPRSGRPSISTIMRLRQVALGDRADDARHFGGRLHHVLDQLVDRADAGFPAAGGIADMAALADPAFLADDPAQALEFARQLVVEFDDLVEGVGNFGIEAVVVIGDANRKISVSKCLQRVQYLLWSKLSADYLQVHCDCSLI